VKDVQISYNFVPCDRDQILLLPPDLREWLSAKLLLQLVVKPAVNFADISPDLPKRLLEFRNQGARMLLVAIALAVPVPPPPLAGAAQQ